MIKNKSQEVYVPIDVINILRQVRRTFDPNDIRALAENICKWGLIDPVTLVSLTEALCQEYIDLTNRLHGSSYGIKDLVVAPGGQFIIMLSGERRLRAHRLIWQEGCSVCQKEYGVEKPGNCFARHLNGETWIKAHLYKNLSASDAVEIQLSGNSYIPPPDHEMVEIYTLQFRVKKEKNPKLTIAEFARSIGRSPSTISDYLKIFELPKEVFDFFSKGLISSSVAREIAFLRDNGERDLMWWVRRAVISRLKVGDFRKQVRGHLINRQQSMLEIFSKEAEKQSKKAYIKATVTKEIVEGLWGNIAYFKKILKMFEEGKLGRKDSPFSERSPVHLYREQVELMQQNVLPHIAGFLPKKSLREIEKTLARVELALSRQEEQIKKSAR